MACRHPFRAIAEGSDGSHFAAQVYSPYSVVVSLQRVTLDMRVAGLLLLWRGAKNGLLRRGFVVFFVVGPSSQQHAYFVGWLLIVGQLICVHSWRMESHHSLVHKSTFVSR